MKTPPQKRDEEHLADVVAVIREPVLRRLALFAKEPIIHGKVIFLGDSITEMGDWKRLLNDGTIINRGIGGDITRGALRRVREITARNPCKVFILLGINDIGKGIPNAVIADNYLKIIREIHQKSPHTAIYAQSLLPVNPRLPHCPRQYHRQEPILALNKWLADNATEAGFTYIDLFPLFADEEGFLDSRYTYDGLHLRQPAYAIWVDYLKQQGYL